MRVMATMHRRFVALIPELARFGVVGGIGAIIDLGGAAYLHFDLGIGPMVAKGLSITAATAFTYLGSRFWTFRHRVNQAVLRETVLFAILNIVGLLIAEAAIAFTHYGLGAKSALAYNAASVAGTGLGTIFRYFTYKKWVFLAAEPAVATAPAVPAVPVAAATPARGRHVARHAAPQRHPAVHPPRHPAARPPRYGPLQEQLNPAPAND